MILAGGSVALAAPGVASLFRDVPGVSDAAFGERGLSRFRNFLGSEQVECDYTAVRTLVTLNSKSELAKARSALKVGDRLLERG